MTRTPDALIEQIKSRVIPRPFRFSIDREFSPSNNDRCCLVRGR